MVRSALSWQNAWRVRMVALGCIVLFVSIGSQVLANAVAATDTTAPTTLIVSAYTQNARMADGNWTHVGACAVALSQFSLGTILALYNADGSFNRQCIAEDTDLSVEYGSLRLAMPSNAGDPTHWGVRNLLAKELRVGWGQAGPPDFSAATRSTFPMPHWKLPPIRVRTKIS